LLSNSNSFPGIQETSAYAVHARTEWLFEDNGTVTFTPAPTIPPTEFVVWTPTFAFVQLVNSEIFPFPWDAADILDLNVYGPSANTNYRYDGR
jgi:hypothetical protein